MNGYHTDPNNTTTIAAAYFKLLTLFDENRFAYESELEDRIFGFDNSLKAYSGMLKGLRDPILMQKKRAIVAWPFTQKRNRTRS